jgi:serine/threonine protein kinase
MQKIQSLAPSPYLAPELSGFYLDADLMKCDVYSLGVLALENMTGKEIANVEARTTDVKEMRRILRCSFQYSPGLKRLVEKMVSINPLKRPSID